MFLRDKIKYASVSYKNLESTQASFESVATLIKRSKEKKCDFFATGSLGLRNTLQMRNDVFTTKGKKWMEKAQRIRQDSTEIIRRQCVYYETGLACYLT